MNDWIDILKMTIVTCATATADHGQGEQQNGSSVIGDKVTRAIEFYEVLPPASHYIGRLASSLRVKTHRSTASLQFPLHSLGEITSGSRRLQHPPSDSAIPPIPLITPSDSAFRFFRLGKYKGNNKSNPEIQKFRKSPTKNNNNKIKIK